MFLETKMTNKLTKLITLQSALHAAANAANLLAGTTLYNPNISLKHSPDYESSESVFQTMMFDEFVKYT